MSTSVKGKQLSEQDVICTNSTTTVLLADEGTLNSYVTEVLFVSSIIIPCLSQTIVYISCIYLTLLHISSSLYLLTRSGSTNDQHITFILGFTKGR